MIRGASRTVVAEEGDRVVGFARALFDGAANGYISTVAVANDKQRQGIGQELVKRLMDIEEPENLDLNLYHSFFDNDLISSHAVGCIQTLTRANVKLPTVPSALDHVMTKFAIGQRRPFVRAEILGGIEFAIHIVKG
jgi:GNAT superfamily N-acetyltransferase